MTTGGHGQVDSRDQKGDERDRLADERDRQADDRDNVIIDITDRQAVAGMRHAAGADRKRSASDRKHSELDRLVAAHDRGDANEERAILQTDVLTGLLQRGAGLAALEREAARSTRTGNAFVVVFIDVDGLKHTNDEHGHARGDAVLRTLGSALRNSMRPYDLALRYGGDEFVCILPGFNTDAAQLRFSALQATLASGDLPMSVTFGVAEWRRGEATDALLARADAALYHMRKTEREPDDSGAVAAHSLLNSSAVVSLGIDTLQGNWEAISGADRAHLLERMQVHSSSIDERLREITQGR